MTEDLQNGYVLSFRLAGLSIVTKLKADSVALFKRRAPIERRNMNEYVYAAILRADEPKTFFVIKEFDSPRGLGLSFIRNLFRESSSQAENAAAWVLRTPVR